LKKSLHLGKVSYISEVDLRGEAALRRAMTEESNRKGATLPTNQRGKKRGYEGERKIDGRQSNLENDSPKETRRRSLFSAQPLQVPGRTIKGVLAEKSNYLSRRKKIVLKRLSSESKSRGLQQKLSTEI